MLCTWEDRCCWCATDLVLIPFLVPRGRDNGVPGQFLRRISLSHSNLSARGRPAQQIGTGHIHTQRYGLLFETKALCITELASRSQMEFWKAPCNLEQKDDSSVSQSPLRKKSRRAGRSLGCKNSMGDGGHPCSTPTTDLWRKMSTWNTLNYLFKCLETIFRQWHINQTLPEPGMVGLYKRCPSGGEISANVTSPFLWGDGREKKDGSS